MFKKLLPWMLAPFAAAAFAAVDANKATQADLDGVKGIGPSIAGKILEERTKSPFKFDWQDPIDRVMASATATPLFGRRPDGSIAPASWCCLRRRGDQGRHEEGRGTRCVGCCHRCHAG